MGFDSAASNPVRQDLAIAVAQKQDVAVKRSPSDQEFGLVSASIRYRQDRMPWRVAQIETAGGLVRVRTPQGVQLLAAIPELVDVHGSWWRPSGFSLVASGQRYRMAASLRDDRDADTGSAALIDNDFFDMVYLLLYGVVAPLVALRRRRRWVRILRGSDTLHRASR